MESKEYEHKLENDIIEIFKSYYDYSQELAKNNQEARVFTDHKSAHIKMVLSKTKDVIKAIQQYIKLGLNEYKKESIPFSDNIKPDIITAIALLHDVGLSGIGYTFIINENGLYEKNEKGYYKLKTIDSNNYSQVRINHGLNSAISIFKNRDNLKKLGYSDIEIDEIGVVCMAHFISTSGLKDVSSKNDWKECFDRIDSAINAYNNDHSASIISFNRNILENDEYLSILATEAFAIRLGDVSRDSGPNAESQSGEIIHIDRKSLNNEGGSVDLEIERAIITIGSNKEPITFQKSRQVHVGEQNITNNQIFVNNKGILTHKITIEDGNYAPKCTQTAIYDHMRVLASAPQEKFIIQIVFNKNCTEYSRSSYEEFRLESIDKYHNIIVDFPWD